MRKLALLLCVFSTAAMAENVLTVASHSLMRLPGTAGQLQFERLEVAEQGTLLIPSSITELKVGQLHLGREARIGIAPGDRPLRLDIEHAEIAQGARISAQGAPGSVLRAASPGRELSVRLQQADIESLTLDVRGGRGEAGYPGLGGAKGQPGGCTWGSASHGHDGQDGGNGKPGAAGARVRLEVPQDLPLDAVQVLLEGGEGGKGGAGGKGGRGGAAKGCLLYKVDGAPDGRDGRAGEDGPQGADGELQVVRF